MINKELQNRLARLESFNDHLQSELDYLDKLMRALGFSKGLETIKATAREMIKNDNSSY